MIVFKPVAARPAPIKSTGLIGWIRLNLFSNIINSIVSILMASLILMALPDFIGWAFIKAKFIGESQEVCNPNGACWVFVNAWSKQFFYGSYPLESLWRINLSLFVLFTVVAGSNFLPKKLRYPITLPALLFMPFVGLALLDGRIFGLEYIATDFWGGFSLNVLLAAASIIVSFPLSFLWVLGRQSNMPFIKTVCVILIEFFRGVPVLALFFMGSVMLPLFFAEGMNIDKLIRVWIVLILFMSGYMAEVFRGGFQAVPTGQYEAADSLGLSYWHKTLLILLPQVIKVAMPNILATFVMLFKNTTFLLIIGVFEMLATVQTALSNSNWLGGHAAEGYLFVGFIFWICCFSMSMMSSSIEKKLDTSHV